MFLYCIVVSVSSWKSIDLKEYSFLPSSLLSIFIFFLISTGISAGVSAGIIPTGISAGISAGFCCSCKELKTPIKLFL